MGNHRLQIKQRVFLTFGLAAALLLVLPLQDVLAQSSLGIGRNEQSLPTGGLFAEFFNWVRQQQAGFNQEIRSILVAMRNDGTHVWALITISFLYGVFHAIGPGHGKVVISSYMLANEVEMRRGVFLSLSASFFQGLTAVTVISVFFLALRGTGIRTGDLSYGLEVASYAGVMAIGLWLLWRKVFKRTRAISIDHHDHAHAHDHSHDHHHAHAHEHHSQTHDHAHEHHHQGAGEVCDHCGHAHAPDPSTLKGETFGLREAWTAIIAVGLRPCTGALIVLVFCFANGLYLAGVLSTMAMSLGTGLAVSGLAMLAVLAKNAALKVAGIQGHIGLVNSIIEISGAFLIFLIGFVLFYAAIQA